MRELQQEGAEIPPDAIEIWLEKRAKRLSTVQSNRYHSWGVGWNEGWEVVPVVGCGGDQVLLPVLLPWGSGRKLLCPLHKVPDMTGRRQGHVINAHSRWQQAGLIC